MAMPSRVDGRRSIIHQVVLIIWKSYERHWQFIGEHEDTDSL